jgi:iron complex outermembrane receptor protein
MRSSKLLLVSASLSALSTPAFAQDVGPAPAQPATPDSPVEPTPAPTDQSIEAASTNLAANNGKNLSEVVVTGSRIRRPNFSTPNPVVSLRAAQIQESGTTNLTQFLSGYPALQGSSGSTLNAGDQAGIGYTGLNLLNLRNLGTDRTLVLVDGRRPW